MQEACHIYKFIELNKFTNVEKLIDLQLKSKCVIYNNMLRESLFPQHQDNRYYHNK